MQNCGIVRTFHKEYCQYEKCDCDELEGIHLKEEYFQNNGSKEGVYKKYNYKGKLTKECNFVNGKKNGVCIIYVSRVNVKKELNYVDDKLNGICKEYYNDGSVMKECNYINDNLNGTYREYHPNGDIYIECNYINDKLIGIFKCYEYNDLYEYEEEQEEYEIIELIFNRPTDRFMLGKILNKEVTIQNEYLI